MDEQTTPDKPIEKQAKVPTSERKVLGLAGGEYTRMFLGFVVGLISAGVFYWATTKTPHLWVAVADPITFQGDKNQFGIQNITVINDGSKEVENLECDFTLTDCKIQEVRAQPDSLSPVVTIKDSKATIKVSLLNQREFLQISALTNNPDKLAKPHLSVRGKGVVGETKSLREQYEWLQMVVAIVVATLFTSGVIALGFGIQWLFRKAVESVTPGSHTS